MALGKKDIAKHVNMQKGQCKTWLCVQKDTAKQSIMLKDNTKYGIMQKDNDKIKQFRKRGQYCIAELGTQQFLSSRQRQRDILI